MLSEAGHQPEAEYDAFEHLCYAVFDEDEDGLVFFWKSCFDASGYDSPLLVVAGYLATRHQWKEFNKRWKVPLTRDGKTDLFHATDFETGQRDFTEAKGWDEARRNSARTQLVESIIDSQLELAVYSAVVVKDYAQHMGGWRKEMFGSKAYEFCARNCLASIVYYCHENSIKAPIAHVFEMGDEGQGELYKAVLKGRAVGPEHQDFYKLHSVTFVPKDHAVGLQAADMLAYHAWHRETGTALGEPISRLFSGTRIIRTYYDAAQFTKLHARDDEGFSIPLARNAEIGFKTPPIVDIDVSANFREAEAVLDELESFMETHPEAVYPLIKNAASVSEMFSLETENESAGGTNTLRVFLKPNNLALDRLATLRALDGKPMLGE